MPSTPPHLLTCMHARKYTTTYVGAAPSRCRSRASVPSELGRPVRSSHPHRQSRGDRMTAVFVNGNPETSAIWDSLLGELERRDTLRLSPPGFGAPIPDGFPCTDRKSVV